MLDFSKFTKADHEALEIKISSPEKEVVCPRCGKLLIFQESGNSCEVICPTPDCLHCSQR